MANKQTEKKVSTCNAQDIQKKAYELFEKRGRQPGNEWDDWFKAEKLLMTKINTPLNK